MKSLTCPNCQTQLEFNLISLRGASAYPNPPWSHPIPSFFEDWKINEPIGVACLERHCTGQLLMRKGKWGYFVGCSEYETESKCPGKLTIPCPDKNCDGYLVCRNRKEDGGIFLGCNNFSEKNCRQGKDFDTAIYLANEILKKRAANKWDSSTRPPIKDFKKVNPALQDNIPI